jgi:hypothetical protein
MYAFVILMYATDPANHIKFTGMLITYLHNKFHRPGCRILPLQGPNMWAYRKEVGETPLNHSVDGVYVVTYLCYICTFSVLLDGNLK